MQFSSSGRSRMFFKILTQIVYLTPIFRETFQLLFLLISMCLFKFKNKTYSAFEKKKFWYIKQILSYHYRQQAKFSVTDIFVSKIWPRFATTITTIKSYLRVWFKFAITCYTLKTMNLNINRTLFQSSF